MGRKFSAQCLTAQLISATVIVLVTTGPNSSTWFCIFEWNKIRVSDAYFVQHFFTAAHAGYSESSTALPWCSLSCTLDSQWSSDWLFCLALPKTIPKPRNLPHCRQSENRPDSCFARLLATQSGPMIQFWLVNYNGGNSKSIVSEKALLMKGTGLIGASLPPSCLEHGCDDWCCGSHLSHVGMRSL